MTAYVSMRDADIARVSAQIGRSCGTCSLCCWLLEVPELNKPRSTNCAHCKPEGGCGIWGKPERPRRCADYTCLWLVNKSFPDHWQPLRSRMVVDFDVPEEGGPVLRIFAHPDCPERWREEPYLSDIRLLAKRGAGRYRTVIIKGGLWTHIISPDGVVFTREPNAHVVAPVNVDLARVSEFGHATNNAE